MAIATDPWGTATHMSRCHRLAGERARVELVLLSLEEGMGMKHA